MKIAGTILAAIGVVSIASVAFAMPNIDRVPATNNKSDRTVIIPAHAVLVGENVFSLGTEIDPQSGKQVEGYMIVHPRKGSKKPDGTPGGGNGGGGGKPGGGGDTTSSCYAFLAKDAKWKTVEQWVVNTTNSEGLGNAEVFSILDNAITQWEDAADGTVDGNVSVNILGSGISTTSTWFATDGSMDGINGVTFDLLDSGTIGVTTIWGVFGGKPANRELVEWDQKYSTYYNWSTLPAGTSTAMDFESIATHELGHSVGLGDLYTTGCTDETMYGFGAEGEIYARDLNAGDITGVHKLYK